MHILNWLKNCRPWSPNRPKRWYFWATANLMALPSSGHWMILDGSTFPERHPILRSTPVVNLCRSTPLPPCCQKAVIKDCEIAKSRINNTVPLLLLPGGATIKKSLYSWLPISHPVRKLAIIIQSALRSKHFSAIRKAGVLTSTKAIYHVRSG